MVRTGRVAGGRRPWEGPCPPDRGVGVAFPSKTDAGAMELEKVCFVFEVSKPSTTGSDSIFGKQVLEGASIQKSGQEPLAVVPGLVTRGRPGLRSATSLLLVDALLVPGCKGVPLREQNSDPHRPSAETGLLDDRQGHWQARKKRNAPGVLWAPWTACI